MEEIRTRKAIEYEMYRLIDNISSSAGWLKKIADRTDLGDRYDAKKMREELDELVEFLDEYEEDITEWEEAI